jgi:tRNA pseudouridine38-40 synthase
MNAAAQILFDYDDFTSFAKLHAQTKTNICHITQAVWEATDSGAVFTISADRFLRNMVRAIVGTLLDVGRGKLTCDDVRRIIEQKNRCDAGSSVAAKGLTLVSIEYGWAENGWTENGWTENEERATGNGEGIKRIKRDKRCRVKGAG